MSLNASEGNIGASVPQAAEFVGFQDANGNLAGISASNPLPVAASIAPGTGTQTTVIAGTSTVTVAAIAGTSTVTVAGTVTAACTGTQTVTVAGTVTAACTGTQTVTVAGTVTAACTGTQTVTVAGTSTVQVAGISAGTVQVAGTSTVQVAGIVGTSTVTVAGTVTAACTGTQTVTVAGTSTVALAGTSTLSVSGTVFTGLAGVLSTGTAITSANGTLGATFQMASGTGAEAVVVSLQYGGGTVTTGAVSFFASFDGVNSSASGVVAYEPNNFTPFTPISLPFTLTTANKTFLIPLKGAQQLFLFMQTALTGTATFTPKISVLSYLPLLDGTSTVTLAGTSTVQVAGISGGTVTLAGVSTVQVNGIAGGTVNVNAIAGTSTVTIAGNVSIGNIVGTSTVEVAGIVGTSTVAVAGTSTVNVTGQIAANSGGAVPSSAVLVGGIATTNSTAVSNNQMAPLSSDINANVRVNPFGGVGVGSTNLGFRDVTISQTITATAGGSVNLDVPSAIKWQVSTITFESIGTGAASATRTGYIQILDFNVNGNIIFQSVNIPTASLTATNMLRATFFGGSPNGTAQAAVGTTTSTQQVQLALPTPMFLGPQSRITATLIPIATGTHTVTIRAQVFAIAD